MTPVRFTAIISTALMLLTLWAQVGHASLASGEALASEGDSAPHVVLGEANSEASDGEAAADGDDSPPPLFWIASLRLSIGFAATDRGPTPRPPAVEAPPSRLRVATPSRGPPA